MHRITIADVARHAGVSQTTVSRVLNSDNAVRAKTRDQVLNSIELLRYRPNQAARSLAGRRTARVGMFFEKPYGGHTADLLMAALKECSRRGHMLVAEEIDRDASTSEFVQAIEAHVSELNAVLLQPLTRSLSPIVRAIGQHKLPLVAFSAAEPDIHDAGFHTVGIDDVAAARETTKYLIDLGHREIAFIKGLSFQLASVHRFNGYVEALEWAGLSPADEIIEQGDFSYNSGMEAMERILARDHLPTAVFASNDDMAAGVIGHAFRSGLRVPEDISVVGFDDSPMAQFVAPQLTSVQQPVMDMVVEALGVLERDTRFAPGVKSNLDQKGVAAAHRSLPHTLTCRESVAPPRCGAT